MKISNSAALVLASSASLASHCAFAFTANKNAIHPTLPTLPTSSSALQMAKEAGAIDDGKAKIDDLQLKRMNYQFNRGVGGTSDSNTPHVNPLSDIQSYVPVAGPVLTRKNIQDSTCIVSGSRVTPELFYLLNHEDSAFGFNKIVSLSQDVSKTKKRLLTRTARYTGLLSKLAYEEGTVVPPSSVLEEATNWIALVDTPDELKTLISSASQVQNLSVLFFYAPEAESQLESLSSELMTANPSASLVLVPQASVEEDPNEDPLEADFKPTPIMYYYEQGKGEALIPEEEKVTKTPKAAVEEEEKKASVVMEPKLVHDAEFTFDEANRLAIECLQLQAGAGKTLKVQCMEKKSMLVMMQLVRQESPATQNLFTKLVLGLREAGYERPQEIAYMLDKGVDHMKEAITNFGVANPGAVKAMKSTGSASTADGDAIQTTNAWWEDPEFQKLVKESSLKTGELEAETTTK
ncbi:unnamed protein product [Cylindrotheca closterium]|uniref:Uncharacterized protein n=1 Tax=Cylindrotheca closterium TaxID=2856 RepID=A0AAD2CSE3_9STRA|nr:unnamed protein product [Cylindrotheca closterium]